MDSVSLYLSDILKKVEKRELENFRIDETWLVRHTGVDAERCKKDLREGKYDHATAAQGEDFANGRKHLIVFVGGKGTSARLVACYKMDGAKTPISSKVDDIPENVEKITYLYTLERSQILEEFEGRLVINWGDGYRKFNHGAKTGETKKILSISSKTEEKFPGYEDEKLILPYRRLEEIVEDPDTYEEWHNALKLINAVYLIANEKTGEQYIGVSYSAKGLLERWSAYTQGNHDGGNAGIIEFLKKNHGEHINFQFSILKILPRDITQKEALDIETLFKKKLITKEFGMNKN